MMSSHKKLNSESKYDYSDNSKSFKNMSASLHKRIKSDQKTDQTDNSKPIKNINEFTPVPKSNKYYDRINTSNRVTHAVIDEENSQMNESHDNIFMPANQIPEKQANDIHLIQEQSNNIFSQAM